MHKLRFRLLLVAFLLLVAARGEAATFTVDSIADDSDQAIGDGLCATNGGVCTLPAAIEEANFTAAADTINFAIGTGPVTITQPTALPQVFQPATFDGTTQPGYAGTPIVAIDCVAKQSVAFFLK